jgi:2-C-methyl-D-erythritol 2,4-cyclodiphosphate synthase
MVRVGIGYDLHLLVENRDLFIGGVKIDYSLGLAGHSDGDVLLHAVCDAILGALGEADLGKHFPPSDDKYKNISSSFFIQEVIKLMREKEYKINNLDTVIIADEPKLSSYQKPIQSNLARLLNIKEDKVNIKIKSQEGLSQKKYISAYAVISLISIS